MQAGGEALVLGYLNAKSIDWGSPTTDRRGRILCEWLAAMDMIVINDGLIPTFSRRGSQSFIDVTFATQALSRKVLNWEVLDAESLSDHKYIYFEVTTKRTTIKRPSVQHIPLVDFNKFRRSLTTQFEGTPVSNGISVEQYGEIVQKAVAASTVKRGQKIAKVPYWWDTQIETARCACISTRRKLARCRKRAVAPEITQPLHDVYISRKKELKRLICIAKKKRWRELCDNLENDIWGEGYRIVMKQLTDTAPYYNISDARKVEIASELFPARNDKWQKETREEEVDLFTTKELEEAAEKLPGWGTSRSY
nr:unnamed protein product [Callosobruchus analis]